MSLIQVIFDHKLEQSDIIIPLQNSSKDEAGDVYTNNQPEIQQTSVYGIQSPLIMINKIVVDFTDVLDFELKCIDILPTVKLTVLDRNRLTTTFDTPGVDNELRIQILPRFENKYKKINLTFYITNMYIQGKYITITGEYKSPKFILSNLKSFGEIDTYTLFESIAKETQLGFATNMAVNEGDKRWIYCDNKSYMDLLNNEITRSGTDAQICDYWIDWWNNIVLADIYERYNTKDKDEDMQIWIAGTQKDASEGFETKPQQTVATLHNHPSQAETELYIKRFEVISTFGSQMYEGTDKVFSVYETNKLEYMDYLVQDGDVHKDIFTKYEYLGEVYGDFNYLLQNKKREAFIQKINTNETIKVTLRSPLLGIMRGNHINILWYYNDDRVNSLKNKLAEVGVTNAVEPNIDIPLDNEMDTNSSAGQFVLDRTKSGQYLITGCRMKYDNVNLWSYELTLSRSSINKQSILKDE